MTTQRLVRALNVAEKASVARQISFVLGQGSRSMPSLSKFNPIYKFEWTTDSLKAEMRFTSVRGHLKDLAYKDPALKYWDRYDPKHLITAATYQRTKDDIGAIIQNLQSEASAAEMLVLWLDCDLEGEAIAREVEQVCLRINRNLQVKRARFSALTRSDLQRAINNLTDLNQHQIKAVQYRQELDLRIGCTLTNFQTLTIQGKFDIDTKGPLTYGTCQIPLLSLIIDDYLERKDFQPKKYWEIDLCCFLPDKPQELLWFNWSNPPIETLEEAESRYNRFPQQEILLDVVEVTSEQLKKLRPLPFTTSALLKSATSKLKISSFEVMAAAENLYRSGLISYPRTETNRFHPSVNLTNCVTQLLKHDKYKYLAQKLLEKKMEPRFGNQNDQAHGPIYPTRAPDKPLENVEAALYELIAENFLLCLCEDAEYEKKTIAIVKEDMKFSMQANQIIKEGFLAYSTTDSLRTKKLPELKQGDKLTLKRLKMNTKQTPEPPRLTESMLISRMEAHKIGTDSTIHEHIRNIQEKGYAAKILEEFTPTKLGMGVINAYRSIGSELCNTNLRADMEQNVRDISEGKLDYNEALTKDLKRFEEMYSKVEASKSKFLEGFNRVYKAELKQSSNSPTHDNNSIQCQQCKLPMQMLFEGNSRRLMCERCNVSYFVPQKGTVSPTGKTCLECNSQVVGINDQKGTNYTICLKCFSNPQPHMQQEPASRMPCFKCVISECQFSPSFKDRGIGQCQSCKLGRLVIRPTKTGMILVGCNTFPKCKNFAMLNNNVTKVWITPNRCQKCAARNKESQLCQITLANRNRGTSQIKIACLHEECIDRSLLSETTA